jgi:hypothetical protein
MSLTFRQYAIAVSIAERGGECPDFISEGPIWDAIKSKSKRVAQSLTTPSDAEIRKMAQSALSGNKDAQAALDDYVKSSEKRQVAASNLAHSAALKAHQKIRSTTASQARAAQNKANQLYNWAGRETERRDA